MAYIFQGLKYLGAAALAAACVVLLTAAKEPPYKIISRGVVMLTNREGTSGGTGFLIKTKTGNVVTITNYHVCALGSESNSLYAQQDGAYRGRELRILRGDAKHDLCVLEAAPGIALHVGNEPTRFQAIYVVGHPLLKPQTPSMGYFVSEGDVAIGTGVPGEGGNCKEGEELMMGFFGPICFRLFRLQTATVTIYPGNSGSPATDIDGRVVGVVNSTDGRTNWGGIIPLRFLTTLIEDY